jgi:peptidoglycan/xylan/chitin deacetylase (PgdA/CDA1 family)
MTRVFEDYFRMRASDLAFEPAAGLTEVPGFFRFADTPACFGRLDGIPVASSADSELRDATGAVTVRDGAIRFPFDPDEVVTLLRDEVYAERDREKTSASPGKNAIRQIYYALRPLMPVALRRHLQRRALADWKDIPFPDWPLDCTVDSFLRDVLGVLLHHRSGEPVPFIWFWPDGHCACLLVTHDVETDAGQQFCPELMRMNEESGFRASFQFVPEVRYAKRDDVHAAVRDRGHEINLHGLNHDGRLFNEREEFLRRAAKINDYARAWGAKGFRSPVLYRKQAWFGALEFEYDMSVPNTARLEAQRGGCCTVMPYFIGDLVELPTTTAEDYTLFHILRDYTTDVWRNQLDTIVRFNGLFNLIAHPDYLIDARPRATYRKLLAELRESADARSIWCPLPQDAAAWWRARSRMTLEGDGAALRISGDTEGRARIAYVRLDGDHVTFDLAPQPKAEGARR